MVRLRLVASVLMLVSWNVGALSITGKVVAVADGDTITVLDDYKTRHRVRLAQIDAPEKGRILARGRNNHCLIWCSASALLSILKRPTDTDGKWG